MLAGRPRHRLRRPWIAVMAMLSAVSLIGTQAPRVSAESPANVTIIGVSDSDGSTKNIEKQLESAKKSGAQVEMVKPDGSSPGATGGGDSQGAGSPDQSGVLKGRADGDLLAEQSRKGVALMEPKVESAFAKVPQQKKIIVIAQGNGAGAAGNVLERVAFGNKPVTKDRIAGHILIGDPYRNGSVGAQAQKPVKTPDSKPAAQQAGFQQPQQTDSALPSKVQDSGADKRVKEQIDSNKIRQRDRDGENNSRPSDSNAASDVQGSRGGVDSGEDSSSYGSDGSGSGRRVIKDYEERYGGDPNDNPNSTDWTPGSQGATTTTPAPSSETSAPEVPEPGPTESASPEPSAPSAPETTPSAPSSAVPAPDTPQAPVKPGDGVQADPNKRTSDGVQDDSQYVPDNFVPGTGKDGKDVGGVVRVIPLPKGGGEGPTGQTPPALSTEQGARGQAERGVTQIADQVQKGIGGLFQQGKSQIGLVDNGTTTVFGAGDKVATPGTGILGQRSKGFGDLESRGLSVCAEGDARCASNGITGTLISVLTTDYKMSTAEANSTMRGFVELGDILAKIDGNKLTKAREAASRCGKTVPQSVDAAVSGSVDLGSLRNARPNGSDDRCNAAVSAYAAIASDVYNQASSRPEVFRAAASVALLDPDATIGQRVAKRFPAEFRDQRMQEAMRRLASIGYALNGAAHNQVMRKFGSGSPTGQLSEADGRQLLGASAWLTDAIVRATTGVDQESLANVSRSVGGATDRSTMFQLQAAAFDDPATRAQPANGPVDYEHMTVASSMNAVDFTQDYLDKLSRR